MSIDRFCLVDEKKIYNWMICTQIVEELQRKGTDSWSDHTVYVMQGGVEYLYAYKNPAHAQADFLDWRSQPLAKITLSLAGLEQPSGRLPLTEEEIRKYMEEHKDDDFDFGCDEAEEDEDEL
jgi:hypothetical protein